MNLIAKKGHEKCNRKDDVDMSLNDAKRYRFTVPSEDACVTNWLCSQLNISNSIRNLIREDIRQNGYTDVTCRDIVTDDDSEMQNQIRKGSKKNLSTKQVLKKLPKKETIETVTVQKKRPSVSSKTVMIESPIQDVIVKEPVSENMDVLTKQAIQSLLD